jgi:hypothetical protein
LIYKCVASDDTWKRTLFERLDVRDIQPSLLEALQSNDPDWIQGRALDVTALKGTTQRVDEFAEVNVHKTVLSRGGVEQPAHPLVGPIFSLRPSRTVARFRIEAHALEASGASRGLEAAS